MKLEEYILNLYPDLYDDAEITGKKYSFKKEKDVSSIVMIMNLADINHFVLMNFSHKEKRKDVFQSVKDYFHKKSIHRLKYLLGTDKIEFVHRCEDDQTEFMLDLWIEKTSLPIQCRFLLYQKGIFTIRHLFSLSEREFNKSIKNAIFTFDDIEYCLSPYRKFLPKERMNEVGISKNRSHLTR